MVECFSYSCDLECPRYCPYVALREDDRVVPVAWQRLSLKLEALPGAELHLVDLVDASSEWLLRPDFAQDFLLSSILMTRNSHLTKIGPKFFFAGIINRVELIDMPNIAAIGTNFLSQSTATGVRLKGLPKLREIEGYWLRGCKQLTSVELLDLPELTAFGELSIYGCNSLLKFTLSGLPQLREIAYQFLDNCTSLEEVTIKELPSLEIIGKWFLQSCRALRKLTMKSLPNLVSIKEFFMRDCRAVKHVVFEGLPKLEDLSPMLILDDGVGEDYMGHHVQFDVVEDSVHPRVLERVAAYYVRSVYATTTE